MHLLELLAGSVSIHRGCGSGPVPAKKIESSRSFETCSVAPRDMRISALPLDLPDYQDFVELGEGLLFLHTEMALLQWLEWREHKSRSGLICLRRACSLDAAKLPMDDCVENGGLPLEG